MIPKSFKDMTGMRFERLVVVSKADSDRNGNAKWNCQCDCGNTTVSHGFSLRNGASKSCGCLTTEQLVERNSTHGLSDTPEYPVWAGMLQRCNNSNNFKYHIYGGRGISVCERWHHFDAFYADMGPRPSPDHSIERLDRNGNYCPENCIWATVQEQNNNKSNNHYVEYSGRTMTITQAITEAGNRVDLATARGRLTRGWSVENTVEIPPIEGARLVDITGTRYGRWVVIRRDGSTRRSQPRWLCRCDCGAEKSVVGISLKAGHSTSCGCLKREQSAKAMTTHGMTGSPEHKSWLSMLARCSDPNSKAFPDYGGRGITVCAAWRDFAIFFNDMGTKPSPLHVIGRKDINGNYEPSNCAWMTRKETSRNKRSNRLVHYKGADMPLSQAIEMAGNIARRETVRNRLNAGWSVETALETPADGQRPPRHDV